MGVRERERWYKKKMGRGSPTWEQAEGPLGSSMILQCCIPGSEGVVISDTGMDAVAMRAL